MEAAMIWTVIQGVFTFLAALWPFTPAETLSLIIQLGVIVYGAWGTKDWSKVKQYIRNTCLELEDKIMSNEDKTNMVVDKAWEFLPAKVKILPWVTKELLKNVVISQYTSLVKPSLRLSNKPNELLTPEEGAQESGFGIKSISADEMPIVDLTEKPKPKMRISDDGESMVVDDRPPVNIF